jgi:hypothetical protein
MADKTGIRITKSDIANVLSGISLAATGDSLII